MAWRRNNGPLGAKASENHTILWSGPPSNRGFPLPVVVGRDAALRRPLCRFSHTRGTDGATRRPYQRLVARLIAANKKRASPKLFTR